jgi:uncharacterized protein with GYD domain
MPTFITLGTFTDQGMRAIKDTTKRADMAKEIASKFGVKITQTYWTMGNYDVVTICEAADEASVMALGLASQASGNIRFQTLKAYSKEEIDAVLKKIP